MEGVGAAQSLLKDRSRPPPFPRASSRSSTSSTKTRMTAQSSAGSAVSHSLASPTTPTHAHRYHHTASHRNLVTDRPRSQLSREALEDTQQPTSLPVSSFLHERLQRERKVGSERLAARTSNDTMSASLDLRAIQSSPPRGPPSEGRRPRSSGGSEVVVKKRGLGLKEMEQTISTLHKQNFDLKLELFHRRERQAVLEDQVEKLSKEKDIADDLNENLTDELDKRDKAIEEAVAMIVVLEAHVEQLLREREMVRQVEAEGYYPTRDDSSLDPGHMTPRNKTLHSSKASDDLVALNRMPSFLSEQSENTENLRNVYLGVRGSILSLPKMAEDSPDGGRSDMGGIRSPSLSVLSESSFMSVYGEKKAQGATWSTPDKPSPLDGQGEVSTVPGLQQGRAAGTVVQTRGNSHSRTASRGSGPPRNIGDMLDMSDSPLQRLERLEKSFVATRDASTVLVDAHQSPPSSRRAKGQAVPKTKQEKREALHRVLTNAPIPGRDSIHHHMLPPTPDTISTTTLRHYKNSNDTLSREQTLANERSYLALSETTASQRSTSGDQSGNSMLGAPMHESLSGLTRSFERPAGPSPGQGSVNNCPQLSQLQRPRSADGTSVSHRRGLSDWDTDSSDDDHFGADQSATSTYDCWMQESMQPDKIYPLDPLSSVSQVGPDHSPGRVSPDLFSFPSNTSGWATNAMFGSLGGSGYLGAGTTSASPTPLAQTLDALGASLPAPLFGAGLPQPVLSGGNIAPPPPNRRSSLHARTGSTSVVIGTGPGPSPSRPAPANGKLRKSPVRGGRSRSNSIDARPPSSQTPTKYDFGQTRSSTVPPQQSLPPPPSQEQPERQQAQKQRHYPPTASQAPRSRGLSIFRRSIGSTESAAQLVAPSSAPPTETSFRNVNLATVGIPSWGKRSDLVDDDRASATPPPILRNKNTPSRAVNEDGGVSLGPSGGVPVDIVGSCDNNSMAAGSQRPATPPGSLPILSAGSASRSDGKKKWLGLGRVSSLRNRGA